MAPDARILLLVTVLLAPLQAQDPLAKTVDAILQNPRRTASWTRLARHRNAGAALQAIRRMPREVRSSDQAVQTIAKLADRLGDYNLGIEEGRRLVRRAARSKDWARAGRRSLRLGRRHLRFGATEAGRAAILEARAFFAKAGVPTQPADDRLESLALERRDGRGDAVRKLSRRVEMLERSGDPRKLSTQLILLAMAHYRNGTYAEGLAIYRRLVPLYEKLKVSALRLADAYNGTARMAIETAARMPQGPRRTKLYEEALEYGRRSLAIHEERDSPHEMRLRDHCVMAQSASALGLDGVAAAAFAAEARIVGEQRRLMQGELSLRVFHGQRHHVYEDYALHLARGATGRAADIPRALAVSEDGRLGALRDARRFRGRSDVDWMRRPLQLGRLRRRLKACDTAVLVFLCGEHEAGIVTITDSALRFDPLGALHDLDRVVRDYAEACARVRMGPEELERLGSEAFRRLLAPSEALWSPRSRLVIVGSGRLGALPFAALLRPGEAPLEQRYLAATHQVVHAISLGSLLIDAVPSERRSMVSLGHSGRARYDGELAEHFRAGTLAPLHRAAEEARSVARVFGTEPVLEQAATESAFRAAAREAGILHVAAHAVADDRDGSRSALLLQPDRADDGFVTLGELVEVPIAARLVVLSACRTGAGRSYRGEGVRGLARALMVAGADSVLVSITPVNDQTAPRFLIPLMKATAAGRALPDALQTAQRAMLARRFTANPALWAGFALFGQAELLR